MTIPLTDDPDIGAEALDKDAIGELNQLDKHHMKLRWVAVIVAILAVIAAGVLETFILYNPPLWQSLEDVIVFLAIAPIVSITIIVTFALIGSFKKSGDAEMNLPSTARLVGQSLSRVPE